MRARKIPLIFAALCCCCCALSVSAQSTSQKSAPQSVSSPSTSQEKAKDVSPDSADLAITATVTARELRFKVVGNPTVEFSGQPARDTVSDAVRTNLPKPVQPGVTYRNIGIQLKIVSRFADIERIVAEALGEPLKDVPTTDSVPPQENHATQQNAPAPVSSSQPNGGRPQ